MLDLVSIDADLAEVVADLPVACVCCGQAFSATSTDAGLARDIETDGVLLDVDRSIVGRASVVPAGAVAGVRITVGGVGYRIQKRDDHQDGVGVELHLKAVER